MFDIREALESGKYENKFDYQADKEAYRQEEKHLKELFKQDLLRAFEVENNPKREMAWGLAYDYGHGSGWLEVIIYFEELVELIK